MATRYHTVIVGSGPAGLSAAAQAALYDAEQGSTEPTHILLESAPVPAKTIQDYQKGKFVMAEPRALNLRSNCHKIEVRLRTAGS